MAEAGSNSDTAPHYSSDDAVLLCQDLSDFISHVVLSESSKDAFAWRIYPEGVFIVKSCYECFKAKLSGLGIIPNMVKASSLIWQVKAPSKILFFGWRIIHNRIAPKDQLHERGILGSNDLLCVFCSIEEECLLHILGGCRIVVAIWKKVFEWIGSIAGLSLEEFEGFPFVFDKVRILVKRKIVVVI